MIRYDQLVERPKDYHADERHGLHVYDIVKYRLCRAILLFMHGSLAKGKFIWVVDTPSLPTL